MNPTKFFLSLLIFILVSSASTAQLTGEWVDDNGGCYKIRQVNNTIYWCMDATPRVANVFMGYLAGNTIAGSWADVPGGNMMGNGTLSLRVESNNRMVKIDQTGNYGANVWTRQSCGGILVETWTTDFDCGAAGAGTTDFLITSQSPDGSFQGRMKDSSGPHVGTLSGTLSGSQFTMTRTINPSHKQSWTGTFNAATNTITGTITDPYHEPCSFTAVKQ